MSSFGFPHLAVILTQTCWFDTYIFSIKRKTEILNFLIYPLCFVETYRFTMNYMYFEKIGFLFLNFKIHFIYFISNIIAKGRCIFYRTYYNYII